MENLFKKPLFWIIAIFVIFTGITLSVLESEEFGIDEDVALRVNETTYSFEEFEDAADRVSQEFQMQGMEATEEEIKEHTIERIVQEALLVEHASEKGIEVTQEEVEEQFKETMEMSGMENEEEFLSQLEMQGIKSREELEELLKTEVKIMKLIDLYAEDIEITDEEMEEAYDEYVQYMEGFEGMEGMEQEVLPFEEMEGDMKKGLAQERVYPILLSKIEEMEKEADIEIFVEKEDLQLEEVTPQEGMQIDPEQMEQMEIDIEEME